MTTDNTDFTERTLSNNQYLYKEESYAIRGAVFEVYNQVGCGFLESVYQECLIHEFNLQEIPFQAQPNLHISYKGEQLSLVYQPDFVCFEKIITEIKAVKELSGDHRAQILNYLKA